MSATVSASAPATVPTAMDSVQALAAALNPASYAEAPITKVAQLVTAALPHCTRPDLKDIVDIMSAIARGPYRASIMHFRPHKYERPLIPAHVCKLLGPLSDDLRLFNEAYIFISDEAWLATTSSPTIYTSATECRLWTPPAEHGMPQAVYLTHGHRFQALQLPFDQSDLERYEKLELCRQRFNQVYGPNLEWVVRFLPACLSSFV